MRKKTTRGISLFLVVLMVMSIPAFAMETRASSRIASSSARIKDGIDGNLWVYFSVDASSTMNEIGASEIAIQRYSNSNWITEYTLTSEDTPEMQTTNASYHSASIPYKPKYSGYSYRAVVSVYATDSVGTSMTSVTSKQVTT